MAIDPQPSFLIPCLDSLSIVAEWFFWEYLCRIPATRGVERPAALPSRPLASRGWHRGDSARLRALRRGRPRARRPRPDPVTPPRR